MLDRLLEYEHSCIHCHCCGRCWKGKRHPCQESANVLDLPCPSLSKNIVTVKWTRGHRIEPTSTLKSHSTFKIECHDISIAALIHFCKFVF
jgi:hypothetical protein